MKQYRILFTCVGRRVELIQAFRSAADTLGIALQIWGADISNTAPALLYCDKTIKTYEIKKSEYIQQLFDICEQEHIDALIPTIDTDLLLLSQNKDKFLEIGTMVVVSDKSKIAICRDKRFTADYFSSLGLRSPHPVDDYTKYDAGFPAFIKPKDGSSSVFAYKVNNSEELKSYSEQVPNYIVQPFIYGTEYTIDVFCDFDGNIIYITPRIRLAVRSGEVLRTQIVNDEQMITEMKQLVSDYKPCGAITVQLIRQDATGIDYYIEINPRFGGGAPLSMKAGANSAEALLNLLAGKKKGVKERAACDLSVFSRFDQSICVSGNRQSIKAVIFDLDDTLYLEKDYVKSGYRVVAHAIPQVEGAFEKLWTAFETHKSAIDVVLTEAGIYTEELKSSCLAEYRSHMPQISLRDGVIDMIQSLKSKDIKIGIITDGRPDRQRKKIQVLGLHTLVDEIIVTDELGGIAFRKPNDISFRIMQRRLNVPFAQMVYVGDNADKDFQASKQLGMQSVWLKNEEGLYHGDFDGETVYSITEMKNKLVNFAG